MAEIGMFAAAVVVTASAIGMAMRFGTHFINESARDRSMIRDRPLVLPPPPTA